MLFILPPLLRNVNVSRGPLPGLPYEAKGSQNPVLDITLAFHFFFPPLPLVLSCLKVKEEVFLVGAFIQMLFSPPSPSQGFLFPAEVPSMDGVIIL